MWYSCVARFFSHDFCCFQSHKKLRGVTILIDLSVESRKSIDQKSLTQGRCPCMSCTSTRSVLDRSTWLFLSTGCTGPQALWGIFPSTTSLMTYRSLFDNHGALESSTDHANVAWVMAFSTKERESSGASAVPNLVKAFHTHTKKNAKTKSLPSTSKELAKLW